MTRSAVLVANEAARAAPRGARQRGGSASQHEARPAVELQHAERAALLRQDDAQKTTDAHSVAGWPSRDRARPGQVAQSAAQAAPWVRGVPSVQVRGVP